MNLHRKWLFRRLFLPPRQIVLDANSPYANSKPPGRARRFPPAGASTWRANEIKRILLAELAVVHGEVEARVSGNGFTRDD